MPGADGGRCAGLTVAALPRTRPPTEAHYNIKVQVLQRAKGRSAVAAAAYRAGARLTDTRIGRTFDYSRKQKIVSAFLIAPEGAPDWATDRQQVWDRQERVERHKRAVVAREVLVSLPRELPREAWEPLVRAIVEPYVAAGAVADVALHAPDAADGDLNAHAHVLLTTRALDPATETGFARTKNIPLACVFESGGAHRPGHPGEALVAERARVAAEINNALRAVGSVARADHRSRRERGLDDAPEPTIGEREAARWRRQRDTGQSLRPSRRQQHVGAVRTRRRLETHALEREVEMAKTSKIPYAKGKQNVKAELLRQRLPGLPAEAVEGAYMVDIRRPGLTRVQFRDDSWCEVDHRAGQIRRWGGVKDAAAQGFATAAADALGWEHDTVEWLPPALRAGRGPVRTPTPEQTRSFADRWRKRGYTDVVEGKDGVWVSVGNSRLHDTGSRVTVHGPASENALRALCVKARDEWGSRMEIWGNDDFKSRLWLEAQRQGVEIMNYEPPKHVLNAWEREQAQTAGARAAVARVEDRATVARGALAYLRGESEDPPSPELGAYLDSLHAAERGRLAGREPYELVPELAMWQRRGAALTAEPTDARPEMGNGGRLTLKEGEGPQSSAYQP